MNADKEYLLHLLSCFLDGSVPENRQANWLEIYRIADEQDVGAAVASVVKRLPENAALPQEIKSKFHQLIGFAVQSDVQRSSAYETAKALLSDAALEYLPVKGAVVKDYYPSPELRTSGDLDFILKQGDYARLTDLLGSEKAKQYSVTGFYTKGKTAYCDIHGYLVEFHCGEDVWNNYFTNIFSKSEKVGEYEYRLPLYEQLMYVFLHLVKHLSDRGAGIRMVMDLDVLIRAIDDFDEPLFYRMCETADETNYASILLSFISLVFRTPVKDTFGLLQKTEFKNRLADAILDGGSFGYLVQSTGFYHYYANNEPGKVTLLKLLKAVLRYVFPPLRYVRGYRPYSQKYAFLTPIAYLARAKDALTKRRELAADTFRQIARVNEKDIRQRQFFEEIDKEHKHREH